MEHFGLNGVPIFYYRFHIENNFIYFSTKSGFYTCEVRFLHFFYFQVFSLMIIIVFRITLSIDLIIWYIRALHFCLIFQTLGPKLLMLKKMVRINNLDYFFLRFFSKFFSETSL